jgi:DNA invertase Pin-like site-specific DNA recombinase
LVEIKQDAASGKSTRRRPGLASALALIEAGDADGLVVAKLDRLSRSLVDFASVTQRSERTAGRSLHSTWGWKRQRLRAR